MSRFKARHDWSTVDWTQRDAEIARGLGCSRESVRQQRRKRGLPPSPGALVYRDWSGVDWSMTNRAIAEAHGWPVSAVENCRHRLRRTDKSIPRSNHAEVSSRFSPRLARFLKVWRAALNSRAIEFHGLHTGDLRLVVEACGRLRQAAINAGAKKPRTIGARKTPRTGQNAALRAWTTQRAGVFSALEAQAALPNFTAQQVRNAIAALVVTGEIVVVEQRRGTKAGRYRAA